MEVLHRDGGAQQLKYFVPKLLIQGPEKLSTSYITLLEWGYDDGGGTLRYPFNNSYTMNLATCEFENIEENYEITKERMEKLVLGTYKLVMK